MIDTRDRAIDRKCLWQVSLVDDARVAMTEKYIIIRTDERADTACPPMLFNHSSHTSHAGHCLLNTEMSDHQVIFHFCDSIDTNFERIRGIMLSGWPYSCLQVASTSCSFPETTSVQHRIQRLMPIVSFPVPHPSYHQIQLDPPLM